MNWDMIGSFSELVGAIAVVLTLFYLANQVREASRESRRNRYDKLNSELTHVADAWSGNTDLSDIMFRGFSDLESLSPQETFRFYSSLFRLFRAWEALFQDSLEGTVEQWGAEAARRNLVDILGFPGVKDYWQDRAHWYSDKFQAEVNSLLKKARPVMLDAYQRTDEVTETQAAERTPADG